VKLIIVESPKKARTIQKFAGAEYRVAASYGHVRDLPPKRLGVDVDANFKPEYVPVARARERLASLRREVAQADEVLLATDPDREGEAIAWHLSVSLGIATPRRVTFHAITRPAVQVGLGRPRPLDLHLVSAQETRRVLDRLVGYQVSPVLWHKLARGTSAGRVQSAALRLIAARETEIEAFVVRPYWLIDADLAPTARPRSLFTARLVEIDDKPATIDDEETAERVRQILERATYSVESTGDKSIAKGPPPPFTTSTMQQAASRRFRFSGKQTMQVAQSLYEDGHITYHRTDAVRVEPDAIEAARSQIRSLFGDAYLSPSARAFRNRVQNAQEAHEAVRPTDPAMSPETLQNEGRLKGNEHRLYQLIWQRFLASQMADARYQRREASVLAVDLAPAPGAASRYRLRAHASTLIFPGYLAIYGRSADDEGAILDGDNIAAEGQLAGVAEPGARHPERGQSEQPGAGEAAENRRLPDLIAGEPLIEHAVRASRHETRPPARYTEPSLIRALERLGIGRPSTYATILSTLIDRGYVDRPTRARRTDDQESSGGLVLTPLGRAVDTFLGQHFATIVDLHFTAQLEEGLDAISRGERTGREVLSEFYVPFRSALAAANASPASAVDLPESGPRPRGGPRGGRQRAGSAGKPASAGSDRPAQTRRGRQTATLPSVEPGSGKGIAPGTKGARGRPKSSSRTAPLEKKKRPSRLSDDRTSTAPDQPLEPMPPDQEIDRHPAPTGRGAEGVVCPICGRTMVERTGPYGAFFGCSGFPGCRATQPIPGGRKPSDRPPTRGRRTRPPQT
jgi:DNA topoisomerase I